MKNDSSLKTLLPSREEIESALKNFNDEDKNSSIIQKIICLKDSVLPHDLTLKPYAGTIDIRRIAAYNIFRRTLEFIQKAQSMFYGIPTSMDVDFEEGKIDFNITYDNHAFTLISLNLAYDDNDILRTNIKTTAFETTNIEEILNNLKQDRVLASYDYSVAIAPKALEVHGHMQALKYNFECIDAKETYDKKIKIIEERTAFFKNVPFDFKSFMELSNSFIAKYTDHLSMIKTVGKPLEEHFYKELSVFYSPTYIDFHIKRDLS